ncbi:MAG TPA: TolC family protein [Planctomycetota bacterium]|nr:TolC family protein [Planctomycetota bacterium]
MSLRSVLLASLVAAAAARVPAAEPPAAPPAQAPAPASGALTLREALLAASEEGDAVLASRLEAAAAYERSEAAAAERLWPRIELSEQYARTDDPGITTTYRAEQNRDLRLGRFEAENWRTRGEASYVVFDGGALAGRHEAALAGFSAAMRSGESVRSRAVAAAGGSFLAALYAERQLAVAREEAARMDSRLAVARTQEAGGRSTRADVLLAEYRLERAKREVLTAANAVESARERLGRLLGRDGRVREQLTDGPEDPLAGAAALASADAAEQSALAASPDLSLARAEQSAREAELDARRATRWPRLEAQAATYWDDDDAGRLHANERSYLVGAVLTWTAFDGGVRRARILEARHLAEAAAVRSRDAERRTRIESREAARDLEEARADESVAARKRAADQAAFDQAEKSHSAGRSTFAELLRAQTDLADSRLAELRASHGRRRAELRLLEVTGYWASWQGGGK